ncbi:amidase [Roseicyclus mahoneyensis]|uniref:Aspartyl-tRNA(Asn)/glutamyl-tRNA(Gln) amidotransferase subunit A n=1 Tax=Roseicyclus mahoneyensis TaxID=164332 RepID=A0A316GHJ5_9RHOB|nr:amidase family protein [Roseicyclus mahoneyensis]PWK60030.1 aspartyl-tRNA(Asn)/glutamyl-tRNA(Gln) amidotransferase subunit A [Roseicyclus mahoneyensis]
MSNWLWQNASDLGRGIGAGQIDPVDLAEAYLEAASAHEHGPRIYARLTPERARAEAMAARDRAKNGVRRGLLDGVPLSWKDLFDTAGVVTEAGSMLLEGRVPDTDADVLQRATRAGLVCLGKTHMSELAFSGLGLNPAYGGNTDPLPATPPNVNDRDCVPGGSSSGAAASVAYGLASAGIGSDTGGSVRVPAAWNDLVGLKTTHGRLSLHGVVPLAESFDTVGPLCRTVEDCAELLAVMEGSKPADLRGASLQGARFLVLEPYSGDVRKAPGAAFSAAVDRLAQAGAKIETGTVAGIAEAMDLSPVLFATEGYGTWRDVIEAAPDKMYARILERFRGGADFSAPDFVAAWRKLRALRRVWAAETAGYDAVLLPSVPNLPPHIERLMTDAQYYVTENLLTLRNTRVGNLMNLCGLTLPAGVPSCGLMMLAPPMAEERLLRLGAAAEAALA